MIRPILLRTIAAIAFVFHTSINDANGSTYYVSQTVGNDSYDGLAVTYDGVHGPWKTLTKASEPTFQQGDQLLLKCGDVWNDGLVLKGNGTAANPAVVSSYGTGNRPLIDRQNSLIANMAKCVHLDGNAYGWKLMNLELANAARGIEALASGTDRSFLWFENLYIHGCKFGGDFLQTSGDQNNMQIGLHLDGPGLDKATIVSCIFRDNFVGVTTSACTDITNCLFEHMEWTGLWYVAQRGGLISRNKFMHNCDRYVWCGVSASAFGFTTGGVVEYNEFGETQVVNSAGDGEDLDFEAGCHNITLRYNLFHESAGPASMFYTSASHDNPNFDISIHDNVFLNAAAKPSSSTYKCTFLLFNGNTGAITNNRIYYRDGVPVYGGDSTPGVIRTGNAEVVIDTEQRGENFALAATASASSNGGTASNINDNNSATSWTGTSSTNQWVQLDFGIEKLLNEFVVEQAVGSSISNFVLQYWDGALWKDIFTSSDLLGPRKYMPTWPIATSRARLLINSTASGAPSILEFKAYNVPPVQITTQPLSRTNNGGDNAQFTINATAIGALNYQWRRNGQPVPGAVTNLINISATSTNNSDIYSAAVYNDNGTNFSSDATLTVLYANRTKITQWDFNAQTTSPSIGSGTVSAIGSGVAANGFNTGCSSDTASLVGNNSSRRWKSLSNASTPNKTGGARYTVSTAGYKNIAVSGELWIPPAGSAYWRGQYTTNGTQWIDHVQINRRAAFLSGASGFVYFTDDLTGVPGVENNPNFAYQIVAEYETSAIGSGSAAYVAADPTVTYNSGNGLFGWDMVTVVGDVFPAPQSLGMTENTDGSFVFTWNASAGVTYHFQYADSLSNSQWTTIADYAPASNVLSVADGPMTNATRFYRLWDGRTTSSPVGFLRTAALGNSDTIATLPFYRVSATAATVAAISNNVITVAASLNWTANQFVYVPGVQSNTYYARFTSGAMEGRFYPIAANATNSITLTVGSDSIDSVVAGDGISIEPCWTLNTAFPNGAGVNVSPVVGTRNTEVLIPDLSSAGINLSATKIYFFHAGIWKQVGQGSNNHNDDVLMPNTYFIVRHNVATNTTIATMGGVIASKVAIILQTQSAAQQDNSIALMRPVPLSLNECGLVSSGAFTASSLPGNRFDELLTFDNAIVGRNKSASAVFYYWNGAWRQVGAGLADVGNYQVLGAGTGAIIRKYTNDASVTWTNAPNY